MARLSCLTQRPDVSTGGGVHEFTKIAPEGDKEFNLVGTREYKRCVSLQLSNSNLLLHTVFYLIKSHFVTHCGVIYSAFLTSDHSIP